MANLSKLRVHIAPVGFEIDRIVLPAKQMRADKIWLIQEDKPEKTIAKPFVDKVTSELKKHKIKIDFVNADRKDVFRIISAVKNIFNLEKKNDLYVNVSSGSKIQAIACMMACMLFKESNAIPYYAEPEKYPATYGKPQSSGLKKLIELPRYEIQKPKSELVEALKILNQNQGKITKKEMIKIAEQKQLISVNARTENRDQASFASLDSKIIRPLEEQWKFVEVEKIGRNRWIKITKDGLNAAEFLS